MCKVIELGSKLNDLIKEITVEADKADLEVSTLDKELCDLYHYIEFTDLDVVRGYKIYKEIQSCLRRRREAKNQQSFAHKFKNSSLGSIGLSLDTCIDAINNQKYNPRVRQDLFSVDSPNIIKSNHQLEVEKIAAAVPVARDEDLDNNAITATSENGFSTTFKNIEEARDFVGGHIKSVKGKKTVVSHIRRAIRLSERYYGYTWTSCLQDTDN